MTPEAKLLQLAAANVTLQGFFGTSPFRWFEIQIPQGLLASGACARLLRISTLRYYKQQGITEFSQPRFQLDVVAASPEAARSAMAAVINWLGAISLAETNQFDSPATTPPQFPNFVLNQRTGLYVELQPPLPLETLDFRSWNLEN